MVRPRKYRLVALKPRVTFFSPSGVSPPQLKETVLTVEELEAIRLKDHEGQEQNTCADRMGKVADSLVNGKAIRIQGGVHRFKRKRLKGQGP